MNHLAETECFVAIVAEGSIASAAQRLGMSSSYASKLLKRLEDRLGARLLQRTTRKLTLTEAGAAFHSVCAESLQNIQLAADDLASLQDRAWGRLRVSLPATLGLSWLAPWVASFAAQHPELQLDVVYSDGAVDLVGGGFDIAVQMGVQADTNLIARLLTRSCRVLVASPSYLEAHGCPGHPSELRNHACLMSSTSVAPRRWRFEHEGEGLTVQVEGPMACNAGQALLAAAEQGLGIAYVAQFHAARAIAEGRVVALLEPWGDCQPIYAMYASARHLPAKARLFIDSLAQFLAQPPWRLA